MVGKDGEHSDDEENNNDLVLAPCVNITSWEQNAGSIDFVLCAYNTALIQAGTSEIYVMNTETGHLYMEQCRTEDFPGRRRDSAEAGRTGCQDQLQTGYQCQDS